MKTRVQGQPAHRAVLYTLLLFISKWEEVTFQLTVVEKHWGSHSCERYGRLRFEGLNHNRLTVFAHSINEILLVI